jgi:Cu2+-exporting ATPase
VPFMHLIHSTGFHLSLSIFTFVGPGRRLILDGLKSLFKGSPNMNTLVGLGALSSFAVSSIAAFIPKLVPPTLFACFADIVGQFHSLNSFCYPLAL